MLFVNRQILVSKDTYAPQWPVTWKGGKANWLELQSKKKPEKAATFYDLVTNLVLELGQLGYSLIGGCNITSDICSGDDNGNGPRTMVFALDGASIAEEDDPPTYDDAVKEMAKKRFQHVL